MKKKGIRTDGQTDRKNQTDGYMDINKTRKGINGQTDGQKETDG